MKKNEDLQNPVNPCYDGIIVEGGGKPALLAAFSRVTLLKALKLRKSGFFQKFQILPQKKIAFTLAEVLITLGIIGIVAALTIPTLIVNTRNYVAETRLKKFYSTMNQAVLRSKADNGDVSGWFEDIYGNSTSQREKRNEFFMQYIGKYLNIVKTEEYSMWTIYYLPEGSSFSLISPHANGRDWMFSPGDLKVCLQQNQNDYKNIMGLCAFAFIFSSTSNGFKVYDYAWTGTEDSLKNSTSFGCYSSSGWRAYCTRLIQYNGWKIPDDYPYRLKIY